MASRSTRRALALLLFRRRRRRLHRYWVHPLNIRRKGHGEYNRLCKELLLFPEKYFQYFRMHRDAFDKLHDLIKHDITKEKTNYRMAISSKERLVITLRFLATGVSFRALSFSFRMGETTVNKIVKETCGAIHKNLMSIYIPKINSPEKWEAICSDFYRKWNMPNCVGALDGKHINLFAPKRSGSAYFNYKGTFSIVLMATVDANYKYTMIDVGSYGSNSDGGIFANTCFGKAWLTNSASLQIPIGKFLPHSDMSVPLVLVADEAFPLKDNILRPFPGKQLNERQRIFNYRLSRARRVVENAFGITAHTWRILLKRIEVGVSFATQITVACCILHNFLLAENNAYDAHDMQLGREQIPLPSPSTSRQGRLYARPTKNAIDNRNIFADWFISPAGEVPWQYDAIGK